MATIRIVDVAYVRYRAPDLSLMSVFLKDFGLLEVLRDPRRLYMKGLGPAPFIHQTELGNPGFAALGLQAATRADLEMLAKANDATVEPLDAPGGGSVVRLTDPDAFSIEIVAGQRPTDLGVSESNGPWNTAALRKRIRKTKRLKSGASHVFRLGHCVIEVTDFRRSEEWYKTRFGLITSDEIELSGNKALGAFMRCDRGDEPTDHHTLFLKQSIAPRFNHAAFEVRDLDDLMTGHEHLRSRRYNPFWGVGRHILGSQIFDYWQDPWNHTLEHWTDGDLLTQADPPNRASVTELTGVQWGPRYGESHRER